MSWVNKNKILLIGAIAVFLVAALAAIVGAAMVPDDDRLVAGLRVGGVKIGKLKVDEAKARLKEELGVFPAGEITIMLDNKEKVISLDNMDMLYDFEKTMEKAYGYGRSGKAFEKIGDAFKAKFGKVNIAAVILCDEEQLINEIKYALADMGNAVSEYTYEITSTSIKVTNGTPGDIPDARMVSSDVLEAVGKGEANKPLKFKKEERKPEDVDIDKLYDEVYGEVEDAKYIVEDNKVTVREHKMGVKFDKEKAEKIVAENKEYGAEYEIPAHIESPKLLKEDAEKRIFANTLSSYVTKYNAGDVSRSANIALAAKHINGVVLASGDVFSYNDVVGERTANRGYKNAKVFMNGETVDGIGGGICQVSTTLYSAALYANLEMVERVNHQLPVSYVPLGQDATVFFGSIDLKFKNNTNYPIKIVASASGGTMYVEVLGYKEDKTQKVTIENVTVSIMEPEVKEVMDGSLPEGETKIEKQGTVGSVVDTYKTVTKEGSEPVKKRISRSVYNATPRIIHIGTGKAESITEGETKPEVTGEKNTKPSPNPTGEPDISASTVPAMAGTIQ
jgi:vancomycin resistance protein YoaR